MQQFDTIYNILKENPKNSDGYRMLGDYYRETNINQAFLCYEQAKGFCNDAEERTYLEEQIQLCRVDTNFLVHPVSFVILSYNAKEMMIDCLESIQGMLSTVVTRLL